MVFKLPVPPVRFRVMAPSERPEQETFVTVPFEITLFGSVIVTMALSSHPLSSVILIW